MPSISATLPSGGLAVVKETQGREEGSVLITLGSHVPGMTEHLCKQVCVWEYAHA